MNTTYTDFSHQSFSGWFPLSFKGWSVLLMILTTWFPAACTRFISPDIPRDLPAERMLDGLRQTNVGLSRFKCVAKITLTGPNHPTQSFRAAVAGRLTDHLRIDMFAPYGGSAGTISSDGNHLFLVTHKSREYYKKRFGNGSLGRIIKINVTVGELLELLVGRIPMDAAFSARMLADENDDHTRLVLFDRWGTTRQQVTIDSSMHPILSEWFDINENPTRSLMVTGWQTIDGFVLPKRIDLSVASGQRVLIALDRYEANVPLDESLFILDPPLS